MLYLPMADDGFESGRLVYLSFRSVGASTSKYPGIVTQTFVVEGRLIHVQIVSAPTSKDQLVKPVPALEKRLKISTEYFPAGIKSDCRSGLVIGLGLGSGKPRLTKCSPSAIDATGLTVPVALKTFDGVIGPLGPVRNFRFDIKE